MSASAPGTRSSRSGGRRCGTGPRWARSSAASRPACRFRSPWSATGQVLAARISWQARVAVVLLIIASLNIFVGMFNLLPLLPLDGGHIAVVIYERCRAWLAKLRGKPDPGPVDYRRLVPVSVGVFALLVGFGLLLIMAALVNPVHIIQ